MPTSGHDGERGLLDLADFSLEDLSGLDNSVVAKVIRDLVERRRCGTESTERFNQFNSSL
jgi:hypothetical protein